MFRHKFKEWDIFFTEHIELKREWKNQSSKSLLLLREHCMALTFLAFWLSGFKRCDWMFLMQPAPRRTCQLLRFISAWLPLMSFIGDFLRFLKRLLGSAERHIWKKTVSSTAEQTLRKHSAAKANPKVVSEGWNVDFHLQKKWMMCQSCPFYKWSQEAKPLL